MYPNVVYLNGTPTNFPSGRYKGFYIVTPERKGAGPPMEGKYSESQRSYYVRKYMQIYSAPSASKQDN